MNRALVFRLSQEIFARACVQLGYGNAVNREIVAVLAQQSIETAEIFEREMTKWEQSTPRPRPEVTT